MDTKLSPKGKKRKVKTDGEIGSKRAKKMKKKGEKKSSADDEDLVIITGDFSSSIVEDGVKEISSEMCNKPRTNGILEDWFSPLHHVGGTSTSEKLKILETQGITPVKGPWSTEEVNKLHENMMDFLMSNEVKDFQRFIISATPEDRKFRLKTQFRRKMCRGIRRTDCNIIAKVLYQYSNFLTQGRYSEEEKKELIEMRNSGKSWKDIGLAMNRIHIGMSAIHYGHSKMWNQGPWTKEEDELLRKAVVKFKMASNDNDKGTWAQVSELVGTRPPRYCRTRWVQRLSKKDNLTEDILFTDDDTLKLVSEIYESGVEDEYLIDWITLSDKSDKSVTPRWLRWKWGVLMKEVPCSQYLEFPEIIEKLHVMYQRKKQSKNDAVFADKDYPTSDNAAFL